MIHQGEAKYVTRLEGILTTKVVYGLELYKVKVRGGS